MFKSFAVALLAATAFAIDDSPVRQLNNGQDQENALMTSMINNDTCANGGYMKLDLFTYIAKVAGQDAYEYHGDTVASVGGNAGRYFQYGICIEISKDADTGVQTWDCQQIDVTVPIPAGADLDTNVFTKQSEANQFTGVSDWKYTGSRNDFTWAKVKAAGTNVMVADQVADSTGALSESVKKTADHNWQMSADKSFTNCGGNTQFGFVKCPRPAATASLEDRMKGGINMHWFRNFKTGDAPGYDIQLDGATDKGKTKEVFAFLWNWKDEADYPAAAPWKECLNSADGNPYSTTPVTEAAWTAVYVAPTEPETNPTTPDTDTDDNNTDNDSATQTIAQGTALLGAIYALAF